jgi:hypothetical protein
MQSESELAAAAEKAAIQKDLENWKAIEKELSEKFEQEKRKEREQLYRSREVKNRTSPQLTPEGQSMFKPLTPGDYKGIEARAHHYTNSDKKREIEAAQKEYLDAQKEARKLEKEAQNKAVKQTQQKQTERTLRSARVAEMKMEIAQQATETPKIEQTRTGTAAMTNSTEQIREMIRQREAERAAEREGKQQERGRDRGREL